MASDRCFHVREEEEEEEEEQRSQVCEWIERKKKKEGTKGGRREGNRPLTQTHTHRHTHTLSLPPFLPCPHPLSFPASLSFPFCRWCEQGVYWFFLLVSVILLAAAGAIPTWFNSDSSNGSCGPITYSLDRTQADSIHLWNEQVWEYDAEYWMFSAFALAAAGTLLLLACIASLCVSCCCSCCVSAIAFMLGTATLATLASVVLFAGGLPDTTLVDGSNDEPRTPSVCVRVCV